MKKATITNRVLIGFTLIFMLIAAFSFAAFRETEQSCAKMKSCTPIVPSEKGEMLWDGFSRHFLSLVSIK